MKLLIMQFPPTPATSSLFGPNILLSTLFSNMLQYACAYLFDGIFVFIWLGFVLYLLQSIRSSASEL
jgi:hypothetical protein